MSAFTTKSAAELPREREVEWLWERLIARGTLSLLGGPGGVGKSTLVAALEVAVAAGVPFLEREVAKGEVVHLDYDTDARLQGPWYPRVAAGLGVGEAALRHIRYLEPRDPSRGLGEEGLKELLEIARQGVVLLVLDSWSAAFPYLDPRRADHVAEVMGYLKEIARAGASVLVLDHSPKPLQGLSVLERGIQGSFYKTAAARSAFLLTKVAPRLTGGEDLLRLDPIKNNLAPIGDPWGIRRLWEGDALRFEVAELPEEEAGTPKRTRARRAILEVLEAGALPREELIRKVAERANAGRRTIEEAIRALVQEGALERLSLGGQGGAVAYRLALPQGLAQAPNSVCGIAENKENAVQDEEKFSASPLRETLRLRETGVEVEI